MYDQENEHFLGRVCGEIWKLLSYRSLAETKTGLATQKIIITVQGKFRKNGEFYEIL